jgi:Protein of unknown function (DUF2380)
MSFSLPASNSRPEPAVAVRAVAERALGFFRWVYSHCLKIVPIPPDLREVVAAAPEISNCNGCKRDFGRKAGADWAAWGTVQKVSNLILNINVYMENVPATKMEFVKSVDIRGNTDESWRRLQTRLQVVPVACRLLWLQARQIGDRRRAPSSSAQSGTRIAGRLSPSLPALRSAALLRSAATAAADRLLKETRAFSLRTKEKAPSKCIGGLQS